MKKPPEESDDLAKLRHLAEDQLSRKLPVQLPSMSEIDVRRQLHELQVSQIELELQNTELIRLELSGKAMLARYTDLYDFAPVGYFTVDREGFLLEVNLNGASLLRVERSNLIGQLLRNFVSPNGRPAYQIFMDQVFASGTKESCDIEFVGADKRPFFAQLEANVSGSAQSCFLVVKDVTARILVNDALHMVQDELEAKVSERTAELLQANAQLKSEIAEHRRTEQALQQAKARLRLLAAHQERIKEDERKRIAREIHDDLGQNLLALRLDASMLHSRTGDTHPLLHQRAAEALRQIDLTMKSVRSIINNLRPDVLDLGLPAAIEWQVVQFQRHSGINCELMVEDKDCIAELDDSLTLAVFRILQESLNNVSRHARASRVQIELNAHDNRLTMKVKDNGIGIFPDCKRKATAFGLVGIEERIDMLGGKLHIDSDQNQGQGTILEISIPLKERDRQAAIRSGA